MKTYIQRLLNERDSLTRSATQITDTAAKENRDVTDTEKSSMASMETRNSEIDAQLATFQKQADSMKAYATLRGAVLDADDDSGDDSGSEQRGAELDGAGGAQITESWAEPFTRSGVLDGYTGRGQSEVVELGSVLEQRADITTTDVAPLVTKFKAPVNERAWFSSLLALVTTLPTTSGVVEWVRTEPQPPSEAGEVVEGELKPEAAFTLTPNEDKLKTFAHWKGITRQALEDAPQMRAIIETRLRTGLQIKIASEIARVITTDVDIPAIESPPAVAGGLLAGIRIAVGTFDDETGVVPNGVLLNPEDWAQLDLAVLNATINAAVTSQGKVWNLTIASSSRVAVGESYVGDFKEACTYYDRRTTNVFMTDAHADYFLRNKLVVLGETRGLAVVNDPAALIKVTAAPEIP